MEVLLIFLIVVIITALAVGWIAVCVLSLAVRLIVRLIAMPFRIAKHADRTVANRLFRAPRRMQRFDDVQCSNRLCIARLPAEARFCARCGVAVSRRRANVPALVVDVRSRGLSQVA